MLVQFETLVFSGDLERKSFSHGVDRSGNTVMFGVRGANAGRKQGTIFGHKPSLASSRIPSTNLG